MTPAVTHPYDLLAELVSYPTPELGTTALSCAACLRDLNRSAMRAVLDFAAAVADKDVRDLEELYASVFDFRPERTLDLGYQLFGETYKRGVFLVKMKEVTRAHGVDPGSELPDHLPVVLRLLARLGPGEEPRELAEEVILPAVEKVLRTFDDDGGGYRAALSAVKCSLMSDFDIDQVEPPAAAGLPPSPGRRLPLFPGFDPPSERHAP